MICKSPRKVILKKGYFDGKCLFLEARAERQEIRLISGRSGPQFLRKKKKEYGAQSRQGAKAPAILRGWPPEV